MEVKDESSTFPMAPWTITKGFSPSQDVGEIPQSSYILAVTVAAVMFLITVVPNVMIIMLVIVDHKLRKLSNYYIISLAAADCIVGAVVMPCMASYTILGYWALGGIICDLWITFDFMCCTASMLSLCMISIDRFWAITRPMQHMGQRSRKRAVLFVTAIWTISAVCWVPAIVAFRTSSSYHGSDVCIYLTDPIYVLLSAVFIYYAPMLAMVFLYVNVYLTVKKQSKSLQTFEEVKKDQSENKQETKVCVYRNCSTASTNVASNTSDNAYGHMNRGFLGSTASVNEPGHDETMLSSCDYDDVIEPNDISLEVNESCSPLDRSTDALAPVRNGTVRSVSLTVAENQAAVLTGEQMRKLRLRKNKLRKAAMNRRTARTLGIIVILFLICWLPFVILFPINAFCNCVPAKLYDASYWLAYLNSTLNPFLYGFSRDFRRAFCRLFCKRCAPRNPRDFSSVDDLQ